MLTFVYSSYVRLAYRVAFIIGLAWLSLAASTARKLSLRRKLQQKRHLSLAETNGWLDGADLVLPWSNVRPTNAWWLFMLVLLALSKATDLMTTFVHTVEVQGRCAFDFGLVVTTGDEIFGATPWNGRPAIVAINAQLVAANNGADFGIYKLVGEELNFSPEPQDSYGTWACSMNGEDVVYPAGVSYEEVLDDLSEQGRLYDDGGLTITNSSANAAAWKHLVIWTSSAGYDNGALFDVRMAASVNAVETEEQVMRAFQCSMDAPSVGPIAEQIPSGTVLREWVEISPAYVYDGYETPLVDDAAAVFAMLLNAIIMVAGGSDAMQAVPVADGLTQGCLLTATEIPIAVTGLLAVVVVLAIGLSLFCLVLVVRVRRDRHLYEQVKDVPLDATSWKLYAVAERDTRDGREMEAVKSKQLKKRYLELGRKGPARVNEIHGVPASPGAAEQTHYFKGDVDREELGYARAMELQGL